MRSQTVLWGQFPRLSPINLHICRFQLSWAIYGGFDPLGLCSPWGVCAHLPLYSLFSQVFAREIFGDGICAHFSERGPLHVLRPWGKGVYPLFFRSLLPDICEGLGPQSGALGYFSSLVSPSALFRKRLHYVSAGVRRLSVFQFLGPGVFFPLGGSFFQHEGLSPAFFPFATRKFFGGLPFCPRLKYGGGVSPKSLFRQISPCDSSKKCFPLFKSCVGKLLPKLPRILGGKRDHVRL